MQFLHITDLHFTRASPFQEELTRQMLIDIRKERDTGLNPDFIVFSGDLVNNPDDADVYKIFELNFLRPLMDATGVAPSRVILCPGNHDVSHSAVRAKQLLYETLQAKLTDQTSLNQLVKTTELEVYARDASAEFFRLASRYGGVWESPFYTVESFGVERVTFVAFNSAFGCSLDGSDKDRGHLSLAGELVTSAFLATTDSITPL